MTGGTSRLQSRGRTTIPQGVIPSRTPFPEVLHSSLTTDLWLEPHHRALSGSTRNQVHCGPKKSPRPVLRKRRPRWQLAASATSNETCSVLSLTALLLLETSVMFPSSTNWGCQGNASVAEELAVGFESPQCKKSWTPSCTSVVWVLLRQNRGQRQEGPKSQEPRWPGAQSSKQQRDPSKNSWKARVTQVIL